jgi:hypothetical protein
VRPAAAMGRELPRTVRGSSFRGEGGAFLNDDPQPTINARWHSGIGANVLGSAAAPKGKAEVTDDLTCVDAALLSAIESAAAASPLHAPQGLCDNSYLVLPVTAEAS